LRVVGAAVSGEEMLARLDEWSPDVILQDLLIPAASTGSKPRAGCWRPAVR
jgi:CheY-like chemotaxis protein